MSEYINVTEFAERAGVSKQAVYKRMKKDLNQFTQMVDGVACINIGALELFHVDKVDKNEEKSNEQPTTIDNLVEQLQRELEYKNKLIDELKEENFKQSEHSRQQSGELIELIKQNNKLQENTQVLLAKQQENVQLLQQAQIKAQEVEIQEQSEEVATVQQEEPPKVEDAPKKGLFARMFGK